MTSLEFFQRVSDTISQAEIAGRLGLHPNTVIRWVEQQHVPEHYNGDFKRMLGENGDPDDQFYTNAATARNCWKEFKMVAAGLGINLARYRFIEPSAGSGAFYDLLPESRRIGLDLRPRHAGVRQQDWLLYTPPAGRRYIVIGNPPFGLRGHLALQFINHAAAFADMVAFILPQLFESDGKGVPAKRVHKGLRLAYSQRLPANSFHRPDGTEMDISCVFQVWTRINHDRVTLPPRKTCRSFIRVYSLSNGGTPASTRNKHMIGNCDIYLPSTCFTGMRAYARFEDLPNRRGYGIVIHRNKEAIQGIIGRHDWTQTAFPSTNGALNLRTSLIEDVVTGCGYCDMRRGV